ncbi:hypothetical protein LCGC14_2351260 [marine sediment metagenome]|uniref:Tyr recombinase domain-containing protein n=1 Tax=marine sediment metagenome TaxID=412755 RepID=A0A0F9ELV7_9ZZZZ
MAKRNGRYLSPQEVGRLIEATDTPQDRALLEFLYGTAARVSEVVLVKVDDLDFTRRTVLLHGKAGDRVVPFGRKAAKALRAYLAGRQAGCLFLEHGHPLSTESLRRIVRKAGNQAGLEQVSPIVLRHSCAVALHEAGMNIRFVQALLGHSRAS